MSHHPCVFFSFPYFSAHDNQSHIDWGGTFICCNHSCNQVSLRKQLNLSWTHAALMIVFVSVVWQFNLKHARYYALSRALCLLPLRMNIIKAYNFNTLPALPCSRCDDRLILSGFFAFSFYFSSSAALSRHYTTGNQGGRSPIKAD